MMTRIQKPLKINNYSTAFVRHSSVALVGRDLHRIIAWLSRDLVSDIEFAA